MNKNFEILDMSAKEIVLRCSHCGGITVRKKQNITNTYFNGNSLYCKCCQDKNGEYKEVVDYFAESGEQSLKKTKRASRVININEPGLPTIQIKIEDEKVRISA